MKLGNHMKNFLRGLSIPILGTLLSMGYKNIETNHNNLSNTNPKSQQTIIKQQTDQNINTGLINRTPTPSVNNNSNTDQVRFIIHTLQIIKKKINDKEDLSSQEWSFLKNYAESLKNKKKSDLEWYEGDAIFFYHKIIFRNSKSDQELRQAVAKFINQNSKHLDPNLLLVNVDNKKAIKMQGHIIIIDFSKINPNLAANIIRQCNKYHINYKLAFTIFLIENDFGHIESSKDGAEGMGQVMPAYLRILYGNRKTTQWEKFIATFKYLKEIESELNIDISNTHEISDQAFILALNGYHDGVTNMLKSPFKTYTVKDQGYKYALKGLIALKRIKFEIPKEYEKGDDGRFVVTNSTLL